MSVRNVHIPDATVPPRLLQPQVMQSTWCCLGQLGHLGLGVISRDLATDVVAKFLVDLSEAFFVEELLRHHHFTDIVFCCILLG